MYVGVGVGGREGVQYNPGQNMLLCLGPFTLAKISGLSTGCTQHLHLAIPRTDVSRAQLCSREGLSTAGILLLIICCLEHRAMVWSYGVVPKGLLIFLSSLYKEGAKTTSGTLVQLYRFQRQTARKKFLISKNTVSSTYNV